MTLDASGNLGVGTTSPSTRFSLGGGIGQKLSVYDLSNIRSGFGVDMGGSSYELSIFSGYNGGNGTITFGGLNTATNTYTERARIDSSGNLLVNITTPSARLGNSQLLVNGLISSVTGSTPNAAMNGQVAFGGSTGSPMAGRVFFGDNSGWEWEWGPITAAPAYIRRFVFTDTGFAYNSSGTWGTISDGRLKENIVDATPKLDDLMQLRVRNFNFIAEPGKKQIGFVAQEVEDIFPGLVDNSKPDEEGNSSKSVKTTVLIPILVKAIQEQQAIIEQLKARLDAANL
jgi:hypothetical protein